MKTIGMKCFICQTLLCFIFFALCTRASCEAHGWTVFQLTEDELNDVYPKISGEQIVWQKGTDDQKEVFLYRLDEGRMLRVTENAQEDRNAMIDQNWVVWETYDGDDFEVMLYDDATGWSLQLTDNDGDDLEVQISQGIVAWAGFDGCDYEIYAYDISEGSTSVLTDNEVDDRDPAISGGTIAWLQTTSEGIEVFCHDIEGGTTTQLTDNEVEEAWVRTNGAYVAWVSPAFGNYSEIYLFNTADGTTTRVTNNDDIDNAPELSEGYLTWYGGHVADDYEIFLYDLSTHEKTQVTNDSERDWMPQIEGSNVAWYGRDGDDNDIFFNDGTTTVQITENDITDYHPRLSGRTMVWFGHGEDQYKCEVYVAVSREPRIVYVDCDALQGNNDGSSWCDAYVTVSEALRQSVSGDEIRAASGIYFPDTEGLSDPREATFKPYDGVKLMGGYAGFGEPDPDARDPRAYLTVLSGDLMGDDFGGTDDPSRADNAYSVVTGSGTQPSALIDGFTVTGGNSREWGGGGGMYNSAGSPTVRNCVFIRNKAHWRGGGMLNLQGASPLVENCIFSQNACPLAGGGGVQNHNESNPRFVDCTFLGNTANHGGGICNGGSSSSFERCRMISNTSTDRGGGVWIYGGTQSFVECEFVSNSSNSGGGGIYAQTGELEITGCSFRNNLGSAILNATETMVADGCSFVENSCAGYGGAIGNYSSDAVISNCVFNGNSVEGHDYAYGGAIYNSDSSPTIRNCLLVRNRCKYQGGAIYNSSSSSPTVSYCTLSMNEITGSLTAASGAGMCNSGSSRPTIQNSILWGNSSLGSQSEDAQISYTSLPYIDNCCVQGWSGAMGGSGNFLSDPLFTSGCEHEYYLSHISSGQTGDSPCIDTGSEPIEGTGLEELSTRIDGVPDSGDSDLGYHTVFSPHIYSVEITNAMATISWTSRPGKSYTVLISNDLVSWTSHIVGEMDNWSTVVSQTGPTYFRVIEDD